MSTHFDTIADSLLADGATDDVLYHDLAAVMDRVGVPLASHRRYADQPAIMRLFADRGVTFISEAAAQRAAAAAANIREWYAPGVTPMPGED